MGDRQGGGAAITIGVMRTEEQILGVGRFHYAAFIEGNKWWIPGADHLAKVVPPPRTGTTLVASFDGEVVGTMTIDQYRAGEAPPAVEAKYRFSLFHELDPELQVALITKLAVRADFRGRKLGSRGRTVAEMLFGVAYPQLAKRGLPLAFWDATSSIVKYYRWIGARPYLANQRTDRLGVVIPQVLALFDLERFEEKRSPLMVVATKMGLEHDPHGRDLINRVAPRAATSEQTDITVPLAAVSPIQTALPFVNVPPYWMELLQEGVRVRSLRAGDVLLDPAQDNLDLYVVRRGILDIVDPATRRIVAQAIAGEPLGERSWDRGYKPGAIVRACEEVEVYEIDGATLKDLLEADVFVAMEFLHNMNEVLTERGNRLMSFVDRPETI
jgi:hypothetical protein